MYIFIVLFFGWYVLSPPIMMPPVDVINVNPYCKNLVSSVHDSEKQCWWKNTKMFDQFKKVSHPVSRYFIWPLDGTQTGITPYDLSGPRSNDNEGVFSLPRYLRFRIIPRSPFYFRSTPVLKKVENYDQSEFHWKRNIFFD